MRVALIPSAYAPAVGGVEELTYRLAARLKNKGHAVQVWAHRHPSTLPSSESILGIDVRRFTFALPAASPGALLRFPLDASRGWRELNGAFRDFVPELLHVQCFSANGIYASALSARYRVPLFVSLQGETVMDDNDVYDHSVMLRWGLRRAMHRADAVSACSTFVLDDAIKRFDLSPRRGMVIPNGVEMEYSRATHPIQVPNERFVFAVGRMVHKKGFDLLLDAFARLATERPDVGLVIGGDGASRSDLVRQTERLGLSDRVLLPGVLTRAQVTWAMDHAECFVLPSRVEPFGIVVLEALRAGCPVVVSSRGGAPEIVRDSEIGQVVDPFDDRALAEGIGAALNRDSASASGRQKRQDAAGAYAWGHVAQSYAAVYERLVSEEASAI